MACEWWQSLILIVVGIVTVGAVGISWNVKVLSHLAVREQERTKTLLEGIRSIVEFLLEDDARTEE